MLLCLVFTEGLLRREGRFRRPTFFQTGLVLLCLVGFASVVCSQDGGSGLAGVLSGRSLVGIGLAILAVFIVSPASCNLLASLLRALWSSRQTHRGLGLVDK